MQMYVLLYQTECAKQRGHFYHREYHFTRSEQFNNENVAFNRQIDLQRLLPDYTRMLGNSRSSNEGTAGRASAFPHHCSWAAGFAGPSSARSLSGASRPDP